MADQPDISNPNQTPPPSGGDLPKASPPPPPSSKPSEPPSNLPRTDLKPPSEPLASGPASGEEPSPVAPSLPESPPGTPLKPPEPVSPTPASPPASSPPEEAAQALITKEPGRGINFKKIFSFLFILIILAGLIFGGYKLILPRLKPVSKEVTLTYWGLWEPETVYSSVISEYQQSHPNVKIEYVRHSPQDYRQRLQSALARNEGPDIFRFHNTWMPMLKRELASIPASVMDSATFESLFYPVMRQDLRVGNNYVGLPLEIDGLGVFVNEEIFERGGKTIPSSLTWDELRRLACDLTSINEQDEIEVAGAALGRTENIEHWSDILALMMLQNGADLTSPTDKRAQDTIRYFAMFGQRTTDCSRTWDETLPNSTAAFAGGKVAMYFGPSWEVFEINRLNPGLRYRVIPVPQLPGTNITWASYWVEGVAQKSENQDEAWQFLKYLSEKSTMQKLFEAESKIRLFGEPYARTDMADLLQGDLYVGAYIRQASAAQSWYLASRTFDNGLNDSMIEAYGAVVGLAAEGKSIERELETLAQKIGQLLSQYEVGAAVVR